MQALAGRLGWEVERRRAADPLAGPPVVGGRDAGKRLERAAGVSGRRRARPGGHRLPVPDLSRPCPRASWPRSGRRSSTRRPWPRWPPPLDVGDALLLGKGEGAVGRPGEAVDPRRRHGGADRRRLPRPGLGGGDRAGDAAARRPDRAGRRRPGRPGLQDPAAGALRPPLRRASPLPGRRRRPRSRQALRRLRSGRGHGVGHRSGPLQEAGRAGRGPGGLGGCRRAASADAATPTGAARRRRPDGRAARWRRPRPGADARRRPRRRRRDAAVGRA